jgi:hypothetical protein
MSDPFVDREAIEIEVAPGTVDTEAISQNAFPVEAWEFESPETTDPELTLKSPWVLLLNAVDVADKLSQLEARIQAIAGKWREPDRLQAAGTVRTPTVTVT